MKAINPNEIKDNFIELIGKEWMLVSAGDKEKFNMMTASWGGVGVLWNRPVVFAFIRPERYTREFIDARNEFTITFLGPEHRKAHSICGSKSGREIDKVAATGLTPFFTEAGNPVFEEARLTLECKVVYKSEIGEAKFLDPSVFPRWYDEKNGNAHIVTLRDRKCLGEVISPKQFFHHLLRMREEIFSELVMLGFRHTG